MARTPAPSVVKLLFDECAVSKPASAEKTKPAPDTLQIRAFIVWSVTNVWGIGSKIRGGIVYFALAVAHFSIQGGWGD